MIDASDERINNQLTYTSEPGRLADYEPERTHEQAEHTGGNAVDTDDSSGGADFDALHARNVNSSNNNNQYGYNSDGYSDEEDPFQDSSNARANRHGDNPQSP